MTSIIYIVMAGAALIWAAVQWLRYVDRIRFLEANIETNLIVLQSIANAADSPGPPRERLEKIRAILDTRLKNHLGRD